MRSPASCTLWGHRGSPLAQALQGTCREGTRPQHFVTIASFRHQSCPLTNACRADSIVLDAEIIRAAMVPGEAGSGQPGRWSIFGQSFGGFCVVHYLSVHPHAVSEALLTGGLPPGISQPCSAETAYHCLFRWIPGALCYHACSELWVWSNRRRTGDAPEALSAQQNAS